MRYSRYHFTLASFPGLPCFVLWFAFSIIHGWAVKKFERTGNTYHVSDVRWTQGGHRGAVPNYKYMCNIQVSYQSSGVLAILWTSWVLPSDKALDDKSSTLIECEPLPPTFTSCLPDVTHVISVPRPSTFFAALNSAAMYYTECKQKNQNKGGLETRLTIPIMIYTSVHDQSNMIVYFMSCVPDNYKYSFCLSILIITTTCYHIR